MSYLRSLPPQALLESPVEKTPVSVACGVESPLDGICLSESDKTAVLTLIREEVKTCPPRPLLLISLSSLCATYKLGELCRKRLKQVI